MIAQECRTSAQAPGCDLRGHLRVDVFKALGDGSRLAILASLAEAARPLRVSEIGTCCPQDLSVVSRHLAILRDAGVVQAERRGREVYYQIQWSDVAGMLRELADAFERCCADADGRCCTERVEGPAEGLPNEGGS